MTAPLTPAEQEASAADEAFQLALLYLGVETIQDAQALWQSVPAGASAEVAADWLASAVGLVLSRRREMTELAIAYYRLVRALRTGTTVPGYQQPLAERVAMRQLRFEFSTRIDAIGQPAETPAADPEAAPPTEDTPEPQAGSEGETVDEPAVDELDDDAEIEIEPEFDWGEIVTELEDIAEQEAEDALTAVGPVYQEQLNQKIDTDKPAKEVDAARTEAHDKADVRQAAVLENAVLNGARDLLYVAGGKDARVLGYIRRSRTGTPCGFCAMLISRGPELKDSAGKQIRLAQIYTDAKSAEFKDDGDKYHPNCHCYAVPIYSTRQFQLDPAYRLNREYAVLWPKVTKGLSGDDALRAWRNFIDAQNRDAEKNAQTQLAANGQTERPKRAQAA